MHRPALVALIAVTLAACTLPRRVDRVPVPKPAPATTPAIDTASDPIAHAEAARRALQMAPASGRGRWSGR